MWRFSRPFATILIVGAVSCAPAVSPGAPPAAAGAPSLQVESPAAGQTFAGGEVKLSFKTANFTIKAQAGANRSGEGHVHVYLDGAQSPMMFYSESSTLRVEKAGEHELVVELVNHDHTPVGPRQKVGFTTGAAAGAGAGAGGDSDYGY